MISYAQWILNRAIVLAIATPSAPSLPALANLNVFLRLDILLGNNVIHVTHVQLVVFQNALQLILVNLVVECYVEIV